MILITLIPNTPGYFYDPDNLDNPNKPIILNVKYPEAPFNFTLYHLYSLLVLTYNP